MDLRTAFGTPIRCQAVKYSGITKTNEGLPPNCDKVNPPLDPEFAGLRVQQRREK
jgi:hypothetical protein